MNIISRFDDLLTEMGGGKGFENKPKRDYSETRLQIYQNYYMQGQIKHGNSILNVTRPFDCIAFHPVNEFKDKKEAMWAKLKGIRPGIADWVILWLGGWGMVESKTGGSLAPNQIGFKRDVEIHGGKWALAKSVADLRDALIGFGLKCHNPACVEPPASKAEQQAAYLQMMSPHHE